MMSQPGDFLSPCISLLSECRWWESNPHDGYPSEDFKSSASAIPPHRPEEHLIEQEQDRKPRDRSFRIWKSERQSFSQKHTLGNGTQALAQGRLSNRQIGDAWFRTSGLTWAFPSDRIECHVIRNVIKVDNFIRSALTPVFGVNCR